MRRSIALVAAAALTLPIGGATLAAYTATTAASGNRIDAGSVKLTDNDSGSAILSLAAATPTATDSGCIEVTYEGSLPSTVKLYGTTTGTGLDQYLDLTVTRGAYSAANPGFDSCTSFQADASDYIGAGPGVIYAGTLRNYPDDYASAIADPATGTAETWTTAEKHVYRLQVTLQNNAGAQGLSASQTFTWEARNQ